MKVKSLEWIVRGKAVGPVVYASAFGVTRFYSISGKEGNWTLSYPGADCMIHVDGFATQHRAREAAQVDYSARASDAIEKRANPAPSSHVNGWQPISDVPRDGRKIEVIDAAGRQSTLFANAEAHSHFQLAYTKWRDVTPSPQTRESGQ